MKAIDDPAVHRRPGGSRRLRGMAWGVLAIAAIGLGFIAGAATAIARGWGRGVVSVEVANRSGQPVRSVAIEYGSCGHAAVLPARSLAPGQATTFLFQVCGEGGYHLVATLANGVALKGRDGYVENGFAATEVIGATGIVSSVALHAY